MAPYLCEVHLFTGIDTVSVFPVYYEVAEVFNPLESDKT
jgi:hypothetical protein